VRFVNSPALCCQCEKSFTNKLILPAKVEKNFICHKTCIITVWNLKLLSIAHIHELINYDKKLHSCCGLLDVEKNAQPCIVRKYMSEYLLSNVIYIDISPGFFLLSICFTDL
jgi:hypothetical protein